MADRLMAVLPDKIHMIQEQIIINLAILVNHRYNSVRKLMVEACFYSDLLISRP